MVKLGEKIKELRLRDGRTQDALASALGVTAQAVSRWEKAICCPDMEMIPSLANYFGVSIDELFGYDNERAKKVDALAAEIHAMNRQNNGTDISMDACVALAREALIEFPGNETLTFALASVLYNAGYVRHGEFHTTDGDGYGVYDTRRHQDYAEWREAVKLYERLLLSLGGGEMRHQATVALSQLYKNLGEHEKAMALAESAPDLNASKAFLRINAFDGKEAIAAQGEALLECIRYSVELIAGILFNDHTLPPDTTAALLENAAGLFDLICTDRCYGVHSEQLAHVQLLRSYYLWLADERDGAFAALDEALALARQFDSLSEAAPTHYASPLLHHVGIHAETLPGDVSLCAELPEIWPWWSVSECERVKSEMQADPRWNAWASRAKA